MQSARIDTQRLIKAMLIWLILPMTACIALDVSLDLLPWLTLSASVIIFPLASVMITRTALFEFNKVIQEVAPDEDELGETESTENRSIENTPEEKNDAVRA